MAQSGGTFGHSDRARAPAQPGGFLVMVAAAICVPLAFFTVGASSAWNAAEEEAVVSLDRVTTMLHEHALRAFETHEALMTALDHRLDGVTWPLSRERQAETTAFLSALRRSVIPVSGLAVIDPSARVAAASIANNAPAPTELGARAFLDELRKQNRRIMVSPLMRSGSVDGRSFALVRRHMTAQDEESGLIVSLFDASFFETFFLPLRRERGDLIALVREGGDALAVAHIETEASADPAELAAQILRQSGGMNSTLRIAGKRGKPDMLYMVRRVAEYPVYLVQGRSLASVKQQWLVRIAPYALLLLTSIVFMLVLIWRMAQATRGQREAYVRLAAEEADNSAKTQANVRMKRLMDANVFGVVTFANDRIVEANDAFLLMVGKSRASFKASGFVWRTKSGVELANNEYVKSQLLRRGSCPTFETEILLSDNNTVPVLIGATLYERSPLTWTCFVLDLTERREREAQQIFIMRELNHRTKNLLTVIRSIAGQIARTGTGWDDFRQRFSDRLSALASAHDLLVDSNWRGASLDNLIRSQFAQFYDLASEQIGISGQDINLSPRAAQAIGMAFYELITNSVKYGALSTPHGRVDVTWDVLDEDGETCFHIHWKESGGPPVKEPLHHGFGHIVIAEMTARSLQGEVSYTFPADGVEWRLKTPLDAVVEPDEAPRDAGDSTRAA